MIGTSGTLHVGRFAGYPGPIHVELWNRHGELSDRSRTFEMTNPSGDYAEFLPRFEESYCLAHADFRDAIAANRPFQVTASDALDAQVIVEAAHRSAASDRATVVLRRSDDIERYRSECQQAGLLAAASS